MDIVKTLVAALVLFVFSTQSVAAFCIGIWVPPERIYTPPEHTRAMIVYVGNTEAIVVEPLFTGDAEDFGMMLPVPSQPTVTEAPTRIFEELEDLTNPEGFFPMPLLAEGAASFDPPEDDGVEVIEQQILGDFEVTTLRATRVESLTTWLSQNGYVYSDNDEQNFTYYVNQGGYYFVALKVSVDAEAVDDEGNVSGRLSPIDIRFQTEEPIVPIRTVAGNTSMRMTFTLYTLGDVPLYIPGTDIQYAQKLQTDEMREAPSLPAYGALKRWLVRHEVAFDPSLIAEDIVLEEGTESLAVAAGQSPVTVDPQLVPSQSGVLVSDLSSVVRIQERGVGDNDTCPALQRTLTIGSAGSDVAQLQEFLRAEGHFTHPRITNYFGAITQAAVQSWQRANGVVSGGSAATTGYGVVGPMTRAAIVASCNIESLWLDGALEINEAIQKINDLEAELTSWRARLEALRRQ